MCRERKAEEIGKLLKEDGYLVVSPSSSVFIAVFCVLSCFSLCLDDSYPVSQTSAVDCETCFIAVRCNLFCNRKNDAPVDCHVATMCFCLNLFHTKNSQNLRLKPPPFFKCTLSHPFPRAWLPPSQALGKLSQCCSSSKAGLRGLLGPSKLKPRCWKLPQWLPLCLCSQLALYSSLAQLTARIILQPLTEETVKLLLPLLADETDPKQGVIHVILKMLVLSGLNCVRMDHSCTEVILKFLICVCGQKES